MGGTCHIDERAVSAAIAAFGLAVVLGGCHLGGPHLTIDIRGDVAAGDLDGDGDLDLVVAGGDLLSVAEAVGAGWSSASYLLPDPGGLKDFTAVQVADLDGDDDLDVGAVRWNGARNLADVLVWLVGPDGRPGAPTTVSTETLTVDLAFGDVDGDGDADLATVGALVAVHRNDGAGGFGPAEVVPDVRGNSIAVGDLDGDGRDDVVVGSGQPDGQVSSRSTVQIVPSILGGWGPVTTLHPDPTAPSTDAVLLADMDGDGAVDVVTGNGSACCDNGSLSILRGLGGGALASPIVTPHHEVDGFGDLAAGDLDGDGVADVVATGGPSGAWVFFGDGGGLLVAPHALAPQGMNAFAVVVGELGGDDQPDVATSGQQVDVFVNGLDGARDHD